MKWGAILHKKWWAAHDSATTIYGQWYEDGAEYEIKVPSQLRDIILEIQNWLASRYADLEMARDKVVRLEQFFTYEDGIQPSGKDAAPMSHEDTYNGG